MNSGFIEMALDFVAAFPFWREVITLITSAIVAFVSSKATARSEVLKTYREKSVAAYDELIEFLDLFRQNPDFTLEEGFYSKSLILSNHLRVYGSKNVVEAMKTMTQTLNKNFESYKKESGKLYREHVHTVVDYQSDTDFPPEESDQLYDPAAYEYQEAELRKRYRKTGSETFDLIKPVLDAIHKSVYTGKK